jgi:hypothetical protein
MPAGVPSAPRDGNNIEPNKSMHIDNASGADFDKQLPDISNARAGI